MRLSGEFGEIVLLVIAVVVVVIVVVVVAIPVVAVPVVVVTSGEFINGDAQASRNILEVQVVEPIKPPQTATKAAETLETNAIESVESVEAKVEEVAPNQAEGIVGTDPSEAEKLRNLLEGEEHLELGIEAKPDKVVHGYLAAEAKATKHGTKGGGEVELVLANVVDVEDIGHTKVDEVIDGEVVKTKVAAEVAAAIVAAVVRDIVFDLGFDIGFLCRVLAHGEDCAPRVVRDGGGRGYTGSDEEKGEGLHIDGMKRQRKML